MGIQKDQRPMMWAGEFPRKFLSNQGFGSRFLLCSPHAVIFYTCGLFKVRFQYSGEVAVL